MEEKKKGWFVTKKDQFVSFCKQHPEGVLTVVGGLFTVAAGALKLIANKTEYEDNVYMIQNDKVYKLPAKEMNSKRIDTVE